MILNDIASYLQLQGLGVDGQNLFKGRTPDAPDELVSLFDYSGEPPTMVKDQRFPVEQRPRLQVICRSLNPESARTKAYRIYDKLIVVKGSIFGTHYNWILPQQDPWIYNTDIKNRYYILCNYRISKEHEPA